MYLVRFFVDDITGYSLAVNNIYENQLTACELIFYHTVLRVRWSPFGSLIIYDHQVDISIRRDVDCNFNASVYWLSHKLPSHNRDCKDVNVENGMASDVCSAAEDLENGQAYRLCYCFMEKNGQSDPCIDGRIKLIFQAGFGQQNMRTMKHEIVEYDECPKKCRNQNSRRYQLPMRNQLEQPICRTTVTKEVSVNVQHHQAEQTGHTLSVKLQQDTDCQLSLSYAIITSDKPVYYEDLGAWSSIEDLPLSLDEAACSSEIELSDELHTHLCIHFAQIRFNGWCYEGKIQVSWKDSILDPKNDVKIVLLKSPEEHLTTCHDRLKKSVTKSYSEPNAELKGTDCSEKK
uniref:Uncharacterized protein n=1 Tax=Romanomermis culicivorax TaxID=13658 RepID=A0A915HI07_ROMCU